MSKSYFINNPEGVETIWKAISSNFIKRGEIQGGDGTYILPIASDSILGGIKIGPDFSIDEQGVLSVLIGAISDEDIDNLWSES